MADTDKGPTQTIPDAPFFDSSGTIPASGVIAASAWGGPWYTETQQMEITYVRVPVGTMHSVSCTLSSVDTTHIVQYTRLAAVVEASYTSGIDYNYYSTSSFQVPQKFEFIAASTDNTGNSYGALTASALGPTGRIITYQPYYNRIAWDPNLHGASSVAGQTSSIYITGRNYVAVNVMASALIDYPLDVQEWESNNENFLMPANRKASLNDYVGWPNSGKATCWLFTPNYYIHGHYHTSKESLQSIRSFVDTLGMRVGSQNLFANPTSVTSYTSGGFHPKPDVGITAYNHTRHDWS